MRLVGTVVPPAELGKESRDRMFELMAVHFDQVARRTFERDLDEKQWVVVLRDGQTGTIQGFSTLMVLDAVVADQPIKAVFSGDTIVHRDYWGETELASVWGTFVLSLAESQAGGRFYWFLISKGYRTYKFLPLYFKSFYPRHDHPTPAFEGEQVATLAELKFPGHYDRQSGLIKMRKNPAPEPAGAPTPEENYRLRAELAEVPAQRLRDPHIRFFLSRNPGYAAGDELACVTELSLDNLQPVARRVVSRLAARTTNGK